MMRRTERLLTTLVATTLLLAAHGHAQVMIRTGPGGDLVVLHELGVIAGTDPETGDDGVRLLEVMAEVDRDVELERGDQLVMLNGKRVKDAKALRELYEAAQVGDSLKLGVRRGDQRFIAQFVKADAKSMQRGGMRMVVAGPGGEFDDLEALMGSGLVLGTKSEDAGDVRVAAKMPHGPQALAEGDRIVRLNGREVTDLATARELFNGIAVGAEVEIVARRGAETITASFTKVDAGGAVVRDSER